MNELEKLNPEEKEILLKASAYFSLLAANANGGIDETEKKSAIEFSHVKTYSCNPMFRGFYNEVEKKFIANIEQLDNQLPKGKAEREQAIKKEIAKLEPILAKLENEYAVALHNSFITFAKHVSKAHENVIESFIFPIYSKALAQ